LRSDREGHSRSASETVMGMRSRFGAAAVALAVTLVAMTQLVAQTPSASIGREVAVARHLADGQEFSASLTDLLAHGRLLFDANWTTQEGAGRPLTKGTGRPLADPSQPLVGRRAFNRVSA